MHVSNQSVRVVCQSWLCFMVLEFWMDKCRPGWINAVLCHWLVSSYFVSLWWIFIAVAGTVLCCKLPSGIVSWSHFSFHFSCFGLYYYSLLVITFVHGHIVERKCQALNFLLSPVSYDALSITRLCGVCETNMMYWTLRWDIPVVLN